MQHGFSLQLTFLFPQTASKTDLTVASATPPARRNMVNKFTPIGNLPVSNRVRTTSRRSKRPMASTCLLTAIYYRRDPGHWPSELNARFYCSALRMARRNFWICISENTGFVIITLVVKRASFTTIAFLSESELVSLLVLFHSGVLSSKRVEAS